MKIKRNTCNKTYVTFKQASKNRNRFYHSVDKSTKYANQPKRLIDKLLS